LAYSYDLHHATSTTEDFGVLIEPALPTFSKQATSDWRPAAIGTSASSGAGIWKLNRGMPGGGILRLHFLHYTPYRLYCCFDSGLLGFSGRFHVVGIWQMLGTAQKVMGYGNDLGGCLMSVSSLKNLGRPSVASRGSMVLKAAFDKGATNFPVLRISFLRKEVRNTE
jgi:hypothetical protein